MPETSENFEMFASCLPGLEDLLAQELRDIEAKQIERDAGGVRFAGGVADVYRANLQLGLAGQVLVRLGSFNCLNLRQLIGKVQALPWGRFLTQDQLPIVKATARKSRLYHSGAIVERVEEGIRRSLNGKGTSQASMTVRVRLVRDLCTISLDTTGDPLYRRGYRLHVGKAPLREDLARALVLLSGWTPDQPLIDPFMGSGAVLIEAALMARGLAPGRLRDFSFMQTNLFDAELWASVRDSAARQTRRPESLRLLGSDVDPRSLASVKDNATRAGVTDDLQIQQAGLGESPWLQDESPGFVVTNPPYGRRLGTAQQLGRLYQSLGHKLKNGPRSLTILAMDRRLALRTGLDLKSLCLLDNGGLKVRVLQTAAKQQ